MTINRTLLLVGLLLVTGGIIVIGAYVVLTPELHWRSQVILNKVQGKVSDLSLGEILRWIKPGSPVYLEGLAKNPSPYVAITNLFMDEPSRQSGQSLYFESCARCHGEQAEGGTGPSLAEPQQAASDWALFRTVQRGIPGSAMQAQPLQEMEIWQIVAYLRSVTIGAHGERNARNEVPELLAVSPQDIDTTTSTGQWTTFSGSYSGWRYSELNDIQRNNIHQLTLAWLHQIESDETMVETTPLVVGKLMFATEPPNSVVALDASTGKIIWRHRRTLPDNLALCCGAVNRGVAILGDSLYLGTLDAHLVAIDAATGRVNWDTEVAPAKQGYSITSAPLAVPNAVITGVGGGEFGISGFLAAYDPDTGREIWRFRTIPQPRERFSDTWAGGLETGGVPTWGTGSYDPELELVYWGAGHPAPDFNGDGRKGDNLYSNSLLALKADTGELAWHFQFTPHDEWDWDTTQVPVLVDREINGSMRKLVLFANRNGFYYVLDRTNGEFVTGIPFARQTWADGLTVSGRPMVRDDARPSAEGSIVFPGVTGATNWWPPSYSPLHDMFYVPFLEQPNIFFKWNEEYRQGELYLGGVAKPVGGYRHYSGVRALDPATGERQWEIRFPERGGWSHVGGVLTTAGGLLFVGDNESLYGIDSRTGEQLWKVVTVGGINAAPMTYKVDGRQLVTIAAGRSILTFALPAEPIDTLRHDAQGDKADNCAEQQASEEHHC